MNRTKKNLRNAVLLSFVVTVSGYCAMPLLDAPTANLTEKWTTNANNWGLKDGLAPEKAPVNCWTTNLLFVSRSAAMNMYPTVDQVAGGTNASNARFVGNYRLKRIEAIEFDVRTTGLSYNPVFVFRYTKPNYTNKTWSYQTSVIPTNTGTNWAHVVIPLTFSTSWVNRYYAWGTGPTPADAGSVFDEDLGNIVEIFVQVKSPVTIPVAEQFSMTNLKLVGPWSGPFTNGVSVAWMLENGLDVEKILADPNYEWGNYKLAFLACTDPRNTNDVFRVEIGRNAAGRPVLKWKENNRYAKYDLLEGTDLNDPTTFKGKTGFVNMQGSGTSKEAEVESFEVTGPRFYKVQISAE